MAFLLLLGGCLLAHPANGDDLGHPALVHFEHLKSTADPSLPIPPDTILFADDLHEEVVELREVADEDDTEHCFLAVQRFDPAPFESATSLYQSSADLKLTPFHLRVFSSRGSPSV